MFCLSSYSNEEYQTICKARQQILNEMQSDCQQQERDLLEDLQVCWIDDIIIYVDLV